MEPKKAEDEQDDDDKSDQIDDAVHDGDLARYDPLTERAGSN